MRAKGICYDTGFFNRGVSTHEPFDPEVVGRELRIIREDLTATPRGSPAATRSG